MRSMLQYFLFSGLAWFAAGSIVLIAALTPRSRFDPVVRIAIFLALGLGLLAGTPVPWWLAIPLIASVTALAVLFGKESRWLRIAASVLVIAALIHEAIYFLAPRRQGAQPQRIVVIGDSLSSGGFGESVTWPALLSSATGVAVENLSQPSQKVSDALAVRREQLPVGSLVVVAVGGNDMLDGTPADEFHRDLDQLLNLGQSSQSEIVMLELPILPGKWIYGSHQRSLARKHGVALVPRRLLARIITAPGNVTGDELHLSQLGHDELARGIRYWTRL